jgi:microcystin-dependent protein
MDSNIDRRMGLKFDKSGGQIYGDVKIDGSISYSGQDLQAVIDAIVPVGSVIAFAGTSAPSNYMMCDGSSLSRDQYPKLFSAIGTAHGSANASSFNVPDYRGRFLRGVDGSAANDPDNASRTAMATGGSTGNNVGSVQADQIASHRHTSAIRWDSPSSPFTNGGTFTGVLGSSVGSGVVATTALTGGTETRSKNAYVNYIIKYQ